jgi:hypothetical protein
MKKIFFLGACIFCVFAIAAQTYPEPEFSNEVCYLKKDKEYSTVRLEKSSSKMENKSNMISGYEQAYSIEGNSSSVRIPGGNTVSFVLSTGASSSSTSGRSDSMMRVNGIDPNMMSMGGMMDPSNSLTLYRMDVAKGERKIYMMKSGGALPFSNHKNQSSDKITFSIKKIRDGYWVLVTDKPLSRGEYAFTMMGMGMGNMDGSTTLFAFGVD